MGMMRTPLLPPIMKTSTELVEHPNCGQTTGGEKECFWDCEIDRTEVGPIVKNLECMRDCFSSVNKTDVTFCLGSLLNDVIENELCHDIGNAEDPLGNKVPFGQDLFDFFGKNPKCTGAAINAIELTGGREGGGTCAETTWDYLYSEDSFKEDCNKREEVCETKREICSRELNKLPLWFAVTMDIIRKASCHPPRENQDPLSEKRRKNGKEIRS